MTERAEPIDGKRFDWGLHEKAQSLLRDQMELFRNRFGIADKLITNMEQWTGTRLIDWLDHMVLSEELVDIEELMKTGYVEWSNVETHDGDTAYHNPNSMLPPILLRRGKRTSISLKTESLDDFKKKNDIPGSIEGKEFGPFRFLEVAINGNLRLAAVERHGYNGFVVNEEEVSGDYTRAVESFGRRNRDYSAEEDGFGELEDMINDMRSTMATDRIADAFFRVDRGFWIEKNRAARFQKARQDDFGLGWANHDHHAYRSSRRNFPRLVNILELLGFEPREAFYAGEQVGWGAQVMENRTCGIAVFADVDMSPREHGEDFAHKGLKDSEELGTIGLWVGLHGESMLQAGLHHLAIRCGFNCLRENYEKALIGVMAPFSDFPFLKQAFTEGEPWSVREDRTLDLVENNLINQDHYNRFREKPAIGSHVEIIERNSGFAGFNQDSVSIIIKATDPRKGTVRGA